MKRKPIGKDHKGLQAGDEGVLISLVYDFGTDRMIEYRTCYKVSYGPGIPPTPCVIVYKMPNPHVKATGEYTKTMSLERIGQYEFMTCKTKSLFKPRLYARMFTIPLRYHFDRAEFWKQLHRHQIGMMQRLERTSGRRIERFNLEPLIKPNF